MQDQTPLYLRNEKALGDVVYEGGYDYRGRGLLQLTHLGSYKGLNKWLKDNLKDPLDVVKNPDVLISNPTYVTISGLWYFKFRVMNHFAKTGIENAPVSQVTKHVNTKKLALKQRTETYNRALKTLH